MSVLGFILTILNYPQNPTLGWIEIVKDLVVALSAVTTVAIAVIGLNIWKRQLTSKTKFEIARKFLESIYKVRDALEDLRSPFMSSQETQEAIDEAQQFTEEEKKNLTHNQQISLTFNKRWKPVYDARQELRACLFQAEVIWGWEVKDKIEGFNECIRSLFTAISTYTMICNDRHQKNAEMFKNVQNIVFKTSADPNEDKFTKRLNDSIKIIEEYMRPYIQL